MLADQQWKLSAVWRLFALLFLGMFAGGMILHTYGAELATRFQLKDEFVTHVVAFISVQGLGLLWVSLFLAEHHVGWVKAFGFWKRPLLSIWSSLTIMLVVIPIATIGLGTLMMHLLKVLGMEPDAQSTVVMIRNQLPGWQLAIIGFVAVALAPIAEEAIFRGILYPTLKQRGHTGLAWWGTALLFGAIHLNVAAFLPLTFLALVFTWIYERTGNLLAPIAAHCLFNAVNFLLLVQPPKWLEPLLNP